MIPSPFGGFGGMTANQVPQPMQMPAQNMGMQQAFNTQNPMQASAQQQMPQPQMMQPGAGMDPRLLALLRAQLMQQQGARGDPRLAGPQVAGGTSLQQMRPGVRPRPQVAPRLPSTGMLPAQPAMRDDSFDVDDDQALMARLGGAPRTAVPRMLMQPQAAGGTSLQQMRPGVRPNPRVAPRLPTTVMKGMRDDSVGRNDDPTDVSLRMLLQQRQAPNNLRRLLGL